MLAVAVVLVVAVGAGVWWFTATGTLTLHGVTEQVEVPLEAKLVGDTVVVVGSFDITFSDYGVSVPKAPIVLSVADDGTIEMQLLLKRQ